MKYIILLIALLPSYYLVGQNNVKECETLTTGSIKIVNTTSYTVSGRVCLQIVDTRTGQIKPKFCPDFTIEPQDSTMYGDVLKGNIELKYGSWTPDPQNFKKTIYSNEHYKDVYLNPCEKARVIIN